MFRHGGGVELELDATVTSQAQHPQFSPLALERASGPGVGPGPARRPGVGRQ